MTNGTKRLATAEDGAAAIEMAIAVPVLVMFIYGIFTFGQILEADAGMQHAIGEGARYATLCLNPTATGSCTAPTDTQITTRVTTKLFGAAASATPSVTRDTTARTVTISLTYSQQLDFLFYRGPTVTFTRSKVAYYAS
jgi:Flp pilus assembly protein TadG